MEVEPSDESLTERLESRERISGVLSKYGLRYRSGGRVVEVAVGPATKALEKALAAKNFEALEIEFDRAVRLLEDDPPAAVTAACALLEAGGTYRYRVQARHARLVVGSAHALASFVLETWDARQSNQPPPLKPGVDRPA